jgi:hypothetical protein
VLERRYSLVVPLQRKGIKVILGVKSQGNVSFGHINEDEMNRVSASIFGTLQDFNLDGVEFFDDADLSVQPPNRVTAPFDPEYIPPELDYLQIQPDEWNYNRWLLEEWKRGGSAMNDFPYTIRMMFDENIRNSVPMLWREAGYGKYSPDMVRSTAGIAFFIASNSQITYSFNNDSTKFVEESAQRYSKPLYTNQGNPITWMPENQFGPLFIELDGGSSRNILYPELLTADDPDSKWGWEILDFILKFRDPPVNSGKRFNIYHAIYFNMLKPVSEMADDPFYRNMFFKENTPVDEQIDFLTIDVDDWNRSRAIPAEYLFSMITFQLLGEFVDNAYGNHQKDW